MSRCMHSRFSFFFSSIRRHTRFKCDWSSDVCSSDLAGRTLSISPTLSVWCGLDRDGDRARALLAASLERLYSRPYQDFRNLSIAGQPTEVAEALLPYIEAGCQDFSLLAVAESWESAVEHAAAVRHRLIEVAGA